MKQKQQRRRVQVQCGGQAELGLSAPVVTCRGEVPIADDRVLLFDDPDPRELWVGRSRLADHLRTTGMDSVLAIRTFMRQRDWSAFEARCKPGGAPGYHPAGLMSLVLMGTMMGQSSLRLLEGLARSDVRMWWLSGGVMPDHSAIGRFLNRYKDLITESFFEDLTRGVVRLLGNDERMIAVDATVIQAAAARLGAIKQEAAQQALAAAKVRAAAAPGDAKCAAAVKLAQEVIEAIEKRDAKNALKHYKSSGAAVSPTEPSSVVQPMKSGQYAPSYQACIAVDSNRVIVGQTVEGSSEQAAVPHLVEQAERVMHAPISEMLADSAYNSSEIHQLSQDKGFELLAPEGLTGALGNGVRRTSKFDKSGFAYDPQGDFYTCPAGATLKRGRDSMDRGRPYVTYRARGCKTCPLRSQCLQGKANRSIARYAFDAEKEELRAKMQQPHVKRQYERRKTTVEPVFAETKGVQHYVRYRRRGVSAVKMEHALQCCAHNLRRALRIKLPTTRHGTAGYGRARVRGCNASSAVRWTRPTTAW